MEEKKNQIVVMVRQLLGRQAQENRARVTGMEPLCGDGSQRLFYRVFLDNQPSVIAVLANEDNPLSRTEAASAWDIGRHLHRTGVPVPEPLAFARENGLILFEDLGDTRLYDLVQREGGVEEDHLFALYRDTVGELVRMQVKGGQGFDIAWCWQTPLYDRALMLERESGYFLQALCRDFFGLTPDTSALHREFCIIADTAATAPTGFFLHRDFQSRNIMIVDGAVRIIDFQGGRLGPLGYDLASLLIDPYVCLSQELQEGLLDEYLFELVKQVKYDVHVFRKEYLYLSLQRNLQILGAFAFLGKQRGKTFFLPFIEPALFSMRSLLAKAGTDKYPVLAGVVDNCLEKTGNTVP